MLLRLILIFFTLTHLQAKKRIIAEQRIIGGHTPDGSVSWVPTHHQSLLKMYGRSDEHSTTRCMFYPVVRIEAMSTLPTLAHKAKSACQHV